MPRHNDCVAVIAHGDTLAGDHGRIEDSRCLHVDLATHPWQEEDPPGHTSSSGFVPGIRELGLVIDLDGYVSAEI